MEKQYMNLTQDLTVHLTHGKAIHESYTRLNCTLNTWKSNT